MQSQIDPNKPTSDNPTVASVRQNFSHAKNEIEANANAMEALTSTVTGHGDAIATNNNAISQLQTDLADALYRITTLESANAPPPPPPPPPQIYLTANNFEPFNIGDDIMFRADITNTGGSTLWGAYIELAAANTTGPLTVSGATSPQVQEWTSAIDPYGAATVWFTVTIADPKQFDFSVTARGRITEQADQSAIESNTVTGTLTGDI